MKPYSIVTVDSDSVVVDFGHKTIKYNIIREDGKFVDLTTEEDDSDVGISCITLLVKEIESMN